MKWGETGSRPAVAGHYWYRHDRGAPCMVDVRLRLGRAVHFFEDSTMGPADADLRDRQFDAGEWAGPIPEPWTPTPAAVLALIPETPRGPHHYRDANHDAECIDCEAFGVLRQVEGFHEEIGTDYPHSDQVVHAVEAAAARAFIMGLDKAGYPADRIQAFECSFAGFLK